VARFHQRVTIFLGNEHVFRVHNRDTILEKRDTIFQFGQHVFRIRMVIPWIVRTNRVTIWQNVIQFGQLKTVIQVFFADFE